MKARSCQNKIGKLSENERWRMMGMIDAGMSNHQYEKGVPSCSRCRRWTQDIEQESKGRWTIKQVIKNIKLQNRILTPVHSTKNSSHFDSCT